jgi:hypothetical protein
LYCAPPLPMFGLGWKSFGADEGVQVAGSPPVPAAPPVPPVPVPASPPTPPSPPIAPMPRPHRRRPPHPRRPSKHHLRCRLRHPTLMSRQSYRLHLVSRRPERAARRVRARRAQRAGYASRTTRRSSSASAAGPGLHRCRRRRHRKANPNHKVFFFMSALRSCARSRTTDPGSRN